MTDISVQSTTYQVENRSWLLSPHGTEPGATPSVTLDISTFNKATHYPNGYIPSGVPLGKITASGKYGPYSGGTTDEVQRITFGGTVTSYTVTYAGQTTDAISDKTAASLQTALEALSNVGAGNVSVSGDDGGPLDITFQGDLAETDVAQVTTTPTGGGTATVSTVTAGGADASSDGRETCAGLLFSSVRVIRQDGSVASEVGGAILVHGFVDADKMPISIDANGQADLAHVIWAD